MPRDTMSEIVVAVNCKYFRLPIQMGFPVFNCRKSPRNQHQLIRITASIMGDIGVATSGKTEAYTLPRGEQEKERCASKFAVESLG